MFEKEWDGEEENYMKDKESMSPDHYEFNKENPYLNSPSPLKVAMELIA
jgi:hypothetical protein